MSLDNKRCCPTDAPPAACRYTPEGEGMYMAGPIDAKAGILLVTDIFGMHPNSKRFADELGKAGYLVVMPDFFGERAWPENNYPPASFEDPEWVAFYTFIRDLGLHRPRALHGIELLKKMGAKKVGVVGMCWGALLTVDLSASKSVVAAASPHPAFLTPELISTVQTPICLLPSIEEVNYDAVKKAFDNLQIETKVYKHYQTLHHGFLGARFDPKTASDEERRDREEAKNTIINFFKGTLS